MAEQMTTAADGPDRRSFENGTVAAKLVLRELHMENRGLTVDEVHDRTLLPESAVRAILAELAQEGLCTRHRRPSKHTPARFVATTPSSDR